MFGITHRKIVKAIQAAEKETSGEIRVHLSHLKTEADIYQAAIAYFHKLEMSNKVHRNAILLYINPKLRKFALYGDQGAHEKIGQAFWDQLTQEVRVCFQEKDVVEGILHATQKLGTALKQHFPKTSA